MDPPDFCILVADGSKLQSSGSITAAVSIPHEDGDFESCIRLQIVKTVDSWHLLIGLPWLRDVNASVDYGAQRLSVPIGKGSKYWESSTKEYRLDGTASMLAVNAHELVKDTCFIAQPEAETGDGNIHRINEVLAAVTIGVDLTNKERKKVTGLVSDFNDIFGLDLGEIPECGHTTHSIRLDPSVPLTKKPHGRPLTQLELVAASAQVEKLVKARIIGRTIPELVLCCSPTVMAVKKGNTSTTDTTSLLRKANNALREAGLPVIDDSDGDEENKSLVESSIDGPISIAVEDRGVAPSVRASVSLESSDEPSRGSRGTATPITIETNGPAYRMCHNFAQLNRATVVPSFPPGDLEAKVLKQSGKRFLSVMDGLGAFYWIPVKEEDRPYFCFYIAGLGYFRYRRLPMGPRGSPGTYQIAVQRTHEGLLDPGPMSSWMDDFFIGKDLFSEMYQHLVTIFRNCRRDGMKLSPWKTKLFVLQR